MPPPAGPHDQVLAEDVSLDWVRGDMLGLEIPAHGEALRAGGEVFLTTAFRAAGALDADNRVVRITRFEDCPGGSTGRKLLLSVAYERSTADLPTDLFVKFSRDFEDTIRDRAKNQMEAEVRFALLSRSRGFPIAVPLCLFADYHHGSGTGILITQRIPFGTGVIEPLYEKCRDYEMPEPLEHYRALTRAVARLAGAQKSGRLAEGVAEYFPFDPEKAAANDRIRYTERQILNRVSRFAAFAGAYPQLLPANIASPDFAATLARAAPRFLEHELAIKQYLYGQPDFIALCHWNANVDNAWFWRNAEGALECGLLDWGRVSQMNVALALFGGWSAAEIDIWNNRLDELLTLFVTEFAAGGGPVLDIAELKFQLQLFVALMGLAWLLDAPALIQAQIPNLSEIKDRLDPRFKANETARVQLHMMTTVLNLWQTHDFGGVLDRFLRRMNDRA